MSPIGSGDSRIERPIPVIANNAPKKMMDIMARSTDITKPHHGSVESLSYITARATTNDTTKVA